MGLTSAWQLCLVAVISYAVYVILKKPRHKLPPGPKPLPIVGNIFDFPPPSEPEFRHWLKHKDLYGPISSVSVFGTTLILIHDKKMAHDLLDQHSSQTSGRAMMVFANELCGYENLLFCQGNNARYRYNRRLLHQELGTKVTAARFRDAQETEVKRQLVRTLDEPHRLLAHFKTTIAATVLKSTYGYTIEPKKPDILVTRSDRMMTEFSQAAAPMSWAVDMLPVLKYIPENFPGVTFRKTAKGFRGTIMQTAYVPYRFVRRQMESLEYPQSYVSKLVEHCSTARESGNFNVSLEDEKAIAWTAASLYGAAADTTTITLTSFIIAMIQFPHVQQRAQEEIDRVIGNSRLPSFEDRENLPYIDALVKETLRWWPIAPTGFPHTADSDFEFNGYHIPKGAVLLPAVWWFLHDPEVHANPEEFDPERFLSPRNEPDPTSEAFGYGRRICPGQHFADSSLYINIVQTLAAFNLKKRLDENGREIAVDVKAKPGILTHPSAFQFQVAPRTKEHVDLIRRAETECGWAKSDAEFLGNETR